MHLPFKPGNIWCHIFNKGRSAHNRSVSFEDTEVIVVVSIHKSRRLASLD